MSERLSTELDLLSSMYPGAVQFDTQARELSFSRHAGSGDKLVLRLPERYPDFETAEVILARDGRGTDLRKAVQDIVTETSKCSSLLPNEPYGECLDAIVGQFVELVEVGVDVDDDRQVASGDAEDRESVKTVVIWLHHLLATSKRKLAIHPTSGHKGIAGVTKPGYPGVMIFSGPQAAVNEHVSDLKSLNWQAFSVRYEADEEWKLDKGIKEVETMAEVVQCVEEGHREVFLKAVGMK